MVRKTIRAVSHPAIPRTGSGFPAKTFVDKDGRILPGRQVLNHCLIVGKVAIELICRFPGQLGKELFPEAAALVAAAHDIGKISPCFYEKIRLACTQGANDMTALPNIRPDLERTWGNHAGVSQVSALGMKASPTIAAILGQHHGYAPPVSGYRSEDEVFGGPDWQRAREELAEALQSALNMQWPEINTVSQARLIAGLTSVADWIGSGEFFEDPGQEWENQIEKAVDAAGFIKSTYQPDLTFAEIFGFDPFLAQKTLIERISGPGVYVLEAPMGNGKTEAALYAAYQMLQKKQASGIYFALPTQLTSNKIHERFNNYLERVLAPECRHRALLLHGRAWLLDTAMGEEGQPGRSWFHHAKRGLLAPFAVGTLDQALFQRDSLKQGQHQIEPLVRRVSTQSVG